jgi:hypothetical protein
MTINPKIHQHGDGKVEDLYIEDLVEEGLTYLTQFQDDEDLYEPDGRDVQVLYRLWREVWTLVPFKLQLELREGKND